eukprot:3301077-Alexandrium_andersonii.AAC.1
MWFARFKSAIPVDRYQRAHAEAFSLLSRVYRRRPVRLDIQEVQRHVIPEVETAHRLFEHRRAGIPVPLRSVFRFIDKARSC